MRTQEKYIEDGFVQFGCVLEPSRAIAHKFTVQGVHHMHAPFREMVTNFHVADFTARCFTWS